ncbi:hypothetical protein IGI04_042288 [Brassica rapa subsp. trilocularis]|uniref:Uncharacterized protein n=1 Tax=Brassica rapa subsp. trilocularis TaxID=1813537 RepID=A0ABQ7KLK3_BRACM|nr:hypothetical protein IGI04_042288 [Brassica rapa subsp. trilocularis]
MTSVAVHQYTYQHSGPWTEHAGPCHVMCGDFGPRGLSVQYTQDVRGCPLAHTGPHTGRLWLSISTYEHTGPWTQHAGHSRGLFGLFWPTWALCSVHTGRPWVSLRTNMTSVCARLCPSAHTGRPCAVRVCPSSHTRRPWLSISTLISTLVLGITTLALPVGCLGDFGPRGLSVQYTQDVCGSPSAHTGCLWVSVSTHRTSVGVHQHTQDILGCPCVSVCTHRTSVAVHQYTYQHVGPWTQHADPSRGLFGTSVAVRVCPLAHTRRLWLSISTHISTLVHELSTLALPVDYLGDFGPRGLSVQYTQDVCGCPPAHTRCSRLSVCVHQHTQNVLPCPCVSVCVRQHTQDIRVLFVCVCKHTQDGCGCPSVHISARWSMDSARWPFPWTVWVILAHVGCLFSTHKTSWVSANTHRKSVAVRGCPSAHTGRLWQAVAVRQHTQDDCGCPWLSVSTHKMSVAVRVSHTGRLWLSISTYEHTGPWTQHAGHSRGLFGLFWPTWALCSVHTGRPWVSLRTNMTSVCARLCPSAHTGRPCAVRVCPSSHTRRPWLSISTLISTLVLGITTLALPVGCLGDFGPRGLSVQYTQDVCGCPSAHTGCLWVSVSTHRTSVGVHQHTQDILGCPCVSVCTHRTSVAVHQYTYQHVGPWTQHADPSRGLFG